MLAKFLNEHAHQSMPISFHIVFEMHKYILLINSKTHENTSDCFFYLFSFVAETTKRYQYMESNFGFNIAQWLRFEYMHETNGNWKRWMRNSCIFFRLYSYVYCVCVYESRERFLFTENSLIWARVYWFLNVCAWAMRVRLTHIFHLIIFHYTTAQKGPNNNTQCTTVDNSKA